MYIVLFMLETKFKNIQHASTFINNSHKINCCFFTVDAQLPSRVTHVGFRMDKEALRQVVFWAPCQYHCTCAPCLSVVRELHNGPILEVT
jgi:hypothetical protein